MEHPNRYYLIKGQEDLPLLHQHLQTFGSAPYRGKVLVEGRLLSNGNEQELEKAGIVALTHAQALTFIETGEFPGSAKRKSRGDQKVSDQAGPI